MIIYIEFDVRVRTWVTCEADPEDDWDNGSTGGSVSIGPIAKLSKDDGYNCLGIEVGNTVPTDVFLVWAQYSTGDSFGTYGGHYELLEVCLTLDHAEERCAYYKSVTDYSVPWNGYFEDLDFVEVSKHTLGE